MNGGCIDRAPHVVDRERSPYPVAVVGVKGAGAAVVVLAGVVRVGHLVEDAQVHPVCRLIRVDECTWIIEVAERRVDWGHINRIGVYKTHKKYIYVHGPVVADGRVDGRELAGRVRVLHVVRRQAVAGACV